ncbi:hypothetical protein FRC19_010189, partial [Serendipita sp. 401]
SCIEQQRRRQERQQEVDEVFHRIARNHEILSESRRRNGVAGAIPRLFGVDEMDGLEGEEIGEDEIMEDGQMEIETESPIFGPFLPNSYIRKHHHPRTGLPDFILPLDGTGSDDIAPLSPVDRPCTPISGQQPSLDPWSPYLSLADFLFASRMIKTCASDNDIDFILKNLNNGTFCKQGSSKISFQNAAQLRKVTDQAVKLYPAFKEISINVDYVDAEGQKSEESYLMWVKDGMAMTRELVKEPGLVNKWIWYAEKQSMVIDGHNQGEFITHPMSGRDAWDAEGQLDPGTEQVQFPYMVYSDKSNAARFSNVAIWPLCIRPANLPADITNQNSSFAGNNCIALFPKIEPPDGDKNNPNWPRFARLIFHKALDAVLTPFKEASKDGEAIIGADGIKRILVIRFPIIQADLEEQQVSIYSWMATPADSHRYLYALTRGNNASFPSPRCYVANANQSDLLSPCMLRTQEESKQFFAKAYEYHQLGLPGESEKLLQQKGLYPIANAWWLVSRSDVHHALSFDVLHTIWLGIWGKHLWPLIIDSLSPPQQRELLQSILGAPSFTGMLRIQSAIKTEFSDGKHFFSLLQQILPYIHRFFTPRQYPILRLIRLLLEIALHAQFRMQFLSRIAQGERLVREFGIVLKEIEEQKFFPGKSFSFPKMHQLSHLFVDILRKGTADYLGTITGENFHQGLILAYHASNKKDSLRQIARQEDRSLLCSRIQWQINMSMGINDDDMRYDGENGEESLGEFEATARSSTTTGNHSISVNEELEEDSEEQLADDVAINNQGISLQDAWGRRKMKGRRAQQKNDAHLVQLQYAFAEVILVGIQQRAYGITSLQIQKDRGFYPEALGLEVFINFHNKLITAVDRIYASMHLGAERQPDLPILESLPIYPYTRFDYQYTSRDTYLPLKSSLRATPSFHRRSRFDTAFVNTPEGIRPARLHLIFETFRHGLVWQMALVTYFTRYQSSSMDKAIGMHRYQEQKDGEIIMLASLERSCYMAPSPGHPSHFYLNDAVAGDVDLFLRVGDIPFD